MRQARIINADVLDGLAQLPDESVQCCVTSPPYWGAVRDYGCEGQLGHEREPLEYAKRLVDVFGAVRRVIDDGACLWLNVGDVYAASGRHRSSWTSTIDRKGWRAPPAGYKRKDLTLSPFLVADALREDGWFLRQVVIWDKKKPSEPPRLDRPSTSHEHLFQLSASEHYRWNAVDERWARSSVWRVGSAGRPTGHPAPMPEKLVERCLSLSTDAGDTVLDPFAGSGTTGMVALRLNRSFIGIELNPKYVALAEKRIREDAPLLNTVEIAA